MKAWLLFLPVLMLASCTKEDPKVAKDEPKKATPVTSADLGSFNDFLPPSGGATGLAVKLDGSVEGGLPGVDEPGAGGAAAGNPDEKLKVTDPGAEPRAARKYAFVVNRVDKRVLTISQEQERAGQKGGGLTLALTLDFKPTKVQPSGTKFEAKVTNVDLPGAAGSVPPAQAAQLKKELAAVNGITGTFDISPRGEAGEVSFAADAKMQGQLAEAVVQGLSQMLELILPPFPDQPIGLGAKWERKVEKSEQGIQSTAIHSFTLRELTGEGGTIDAEIKISVPKRAIQAKGLPPGATIAVEGAGKYTYAFRFDRLSPKVNGELKLNQHIEVTDQTGKKQAIDDVQLAKHTIDTPK